MIKLGCSKEEKVQGKVDERTIVQAELVDMVISLQKSVDVEHVESSHRFDSSSDGHLEHGDQ